MSNDTIKNVIIIGLLLESHRKIRVREIGTLVSFAMVNRYLGPSNVIVAYIGSALVKALR